MITNKETQLEIIDLEEEMDDQVDEQNLKDVKNLKQSNPYIANPSIANPPRKHQGQQQLNDSHLPKVKPEETEHMQLFRKIIKFFDLVGIIFGTKFRMDWKPHTCVGVWFTSFLIAFSGFSILRQQYIHFQNGDHIRILEVFAVYGIMSSCNQKWIGTLTKYKNIAALIYSAHKLCRQNPVGIRADLIKSGLRNTIVVLQAYSIGVMICITLFVVLPIKMFFVDGVWITLLPMGIIFCDQSTLKGFIAANIVHGVMGAEYGLATIMYTSAFLVSICYYNLQVDLIREDIKDLDEMWNGTSTTTVAYRHAHLYNICKKLQDMQNLLNATKDIYRIKLCIYFCFNYFSLIICLFEITKNSWLPGIPAAAITFIEMLFYCIIGTRIAIANEKLSAIIYYSNWYTYDIKSQRVMMAMLRKTQQSQEIILGPIGPLNVVTFVSVVKSIYYYYTVLAEMI